MRLFQHGDRLLRIRYTGDLRSGDREVVDEHTGEVLLHIQMDHNYFDLPNGDRMARMYRLGNSWMLSKIHSEEPIVLGPLDNFHYLALYKATIAAIKHLL